MKKKRKRKDALSVALRLTPKEGEQVDAILKMMKLDPTMGITRPRGRQTAIRYAIATCKLEVREG